MASNQLIVRAKALKAFLTPSDASRSILPFIPRPIKWLFLLLVLINGRSFPLLWHFNIFRPVYALRFRYYTRKKGAAGYRQYVDSISPLGVDPLKAVHVQKYWASPDDCDWNGHLSNSSYAKNLDTARMFAGCRSFNAFYVDGGWMALAASHYAFIREIPFGANYEIRVSIGGWDNEKWLYLIAHFVSYPKGTSKNNNIKSSSEKSALEAFPIAGPPLPAGAVLNSVTVSRYCFKAGRITVPPSLALAVSGFCSKEIWEHIWQLRREKKLRPLLRGGWKDVKPADRWWETSQEWDQRRQAAMAELGKLNDAIDALKVKA